MKPLFTLSFITLFFAFVSPDYGAPSAGNTPAEQLALQAHPVKGPIIHRMLFAEKDIRYPYAIITIIGLKEEDRPKFDEWREEIGKKLMDKFKGKIETAEELEEAGKILAEYFTQFLKTRIIGFGVEFPQVIIGKK